jgi:hypothetical protein
MNGVLAAARRVVRLRRMADQPAKQAAAPTGVSLSPAQESGPDLPDRDGVPGWVPAGREERWRNSEKVASDLFPGNREAVWQAARAIFADEASYPD